MAPRRHSIIGFHCGLGRRGLRRHLEHGFQELHGQRIRYVTDNIVARQLNSPIGGR